MLTHLSASIPTRVESLVAGIVLDLEGFQRESAETQLELLAVLAPDHTQLAELEQRADINDRAKESLDSAKAAAAEAQWQEAKERISEAAILDPQHQAIAAHAAQIETEWRSWRFQTALSDVYEAIAKNDFKAAETALTSAATYQGDAFAIEQAKTQLEQTRSTYRLSELAELAQSAVNREDWHLAKQYYEAALKIDPAVQYALSGLPRAQARAELHEKLEAVIAQPNRLEDVKVAQATEALAQSANTQVAPRKNLEQQIESIRRLLDSANQEIPIILTSDGLTELTIVRHMRLGTVERLETRLRPGEYTFRGTRIGYRDTLKTVRIEPNSGTMNLHIVCTETI
jgi:tetratricopeptide (TPR) repeat protein